MQHLKIYQMDGVEFRISYAHPTAYKKTNAPCRALVTPIHAHTKKGITKRELYEKESDAPVNSPLRGKSPKQIYEQLLPAKAAELILQMKRAGLLYAAVEKETHSLANMAKECKSALFELHSTQWRPSTIYTYQQQYEYVCQSLEGLSLETLTQDAYYALQAQICKDAIKTVHQPQTWQPGDAAPASAKKRLNLLFLLIDYLKRIEGISIPAVPTRYNGKESNCQRILAIVDDAREYPDALLESFVGRLSPFFNCATLLLACSLDANLRLHEALGLLWGDIQRSHGTQGWQYYIRITGQIDPLTYLRKELPKTDTSYRLIPLSKSFGEVLYRKKETLRQSNQSIDSTLICVSLQEKVQCDTCAETARVEREMTQLFKKFMRECNAFEAMRKNRVYLFEEAVQDVSLKSSITHHSMRRNFCTWAHTQTNFSLEEISQQMGHVLEKRKGFRPSKQPKTQEEIYALCLKKQASATPFHAQQALCYSTKTFPGHTEIPACKIEFTLEPGETVELLIHCPEPDTVVEVEAAEAHVLLEAPIPLPGANPPPASLLANETQYKILESRYPFQRTVL